MKEKKRQRNVFDLLSAINKGNEMYRMHRGGKMINLTFLAGPNQSAYCHFSLKFVKQWYRTLFIKGLAS